MKQRFDSARVRYRGLAKNTQRLALRLGLANLLIVDGRQGANRGRSIGRLRPAIGVSGPSRARWARRHSVACCCNPRTVNQIRPRPASSEVP